MADQKLNLNINLGEIQYLGKNSDVVILLYFHSNATSFFLTKFNVKLQPHKFLNNLL